MQIVFLFISEICYENQYSIHEKFQTNISAINEYIYKYNNVVFTNVFIFLFSLKANEISIVSQSVL